MDPTSSGQQDKFFSFDGSVVYGNQSAWSHSSVSVNDARCHIPPTTTNSKKDESAGNTIKTSPYFEVSKSIAEAFLDIEWQLSAAISCMTFGPPVRYMYNPVQYAFDIHSKYIRRFCQSSKRVLFLGLNPGPWGMSQTGVPFGEVSVVRDWLCLHGTVERPPHEHPSRQVLGLNCHRTEVSGKRFWSLIQELCEQDPQNFFRHCLLHNYCPVAFMTESAKNVTPNELKASDVKALYAECDKALIKVISLLNVCMIVGIGLVAEKRASISLKEAGISGVQVVSIPHPSPRNASCGKNWSSIATARLRELELLHLFRSNP